MYIRDEIIILHSTAYGEKSAILHTLSRKYGRRSFMLRDVRKYLPLIQSLTVLGCDVEENPRARLLSVRNLYELKPLVGIRSSVCKNAISMFLSELLYRSLKEGECEDGLFDWCLSNIMLLDRMESDYANFHIRFMLDYAATLGFRPTYNALLPFMDASTLVVARMLDMDFASAMLLPMNGEQRSRACAGLISYLECHMDTALNIRSLAVLSELF